MSDPELIDRILQTCSFRFRNVVCPVKDKVATITAARLQVEDADWSIVSVLSNLTAKFNAP